jgi:tetratricopeptide (TPR) repeat protein
VTALASVADADANTAKAKQLYDDGVTNYNLGHYDDALTAFEMAYRVRHDAAFLFNIAQCQRQLHRYEDAERSYRAYLRESPNLPATTREQVQKLIGEMEHAVYEQQSKQPPTGTQAPNASPPGETQPVQSSAPTEQAARPTIEARATSESRSPWFTSRSGWLLTGIGVAALGVSAGLLGATVAEHNAAISATTQTAFDDHHANAIHFQQACWPLLGVGAGLVVAGVAVFAVHAKGHHQ